MHQKDKKDKTVFDTGGGGRLTSPPPSCRLDGAFGMRLVDMLKQAKEFVKYNGSEFLILKFDKCLRTNWTIIAEIWCA